MRALAANIEDVMREAAARWTLITYFILSSLFIVIFASAVNLDIVNGSLAGAQLFGHNAHIRGNSSDLNVEQLVLAFESTFSSIVLYTLCTFMAIFATALLVPRLQEKGTIDLFLSRPTGRVKLLMTRYLAGLALAASNIVYLYGAVWLIVAWKTHILNPRFLLAGVINLGMVATMLAFAFVVGVITSSTAVSIIATFATFLFAVLLYLLNRVSASFSKDWEVALTKTLYWVLPKSFELGKGIFTFIAGSELKLHNISLDVAASAYWSTALFGIVSLVLASWLFTRKEF